MSDPIDDFWEINSLKNKVESLQRELDLYRESEKELSDSYLRIRELVGAWDTKPGGEDRFEVTEAAVRKLREDEKRLDWLDAHCDGQALISDDCKCWAVSWDGMQNVPDTDYPDSILTTHYINKEDWKHSVRDAIDVAIAEVGEEE